MLDCRLWINGRKVDDLQGIIDNFNISDIRGYYHGGRLAEWLYCHNAPEQAALIEKIPANENPDKYLYDIFMNKYVCPDYHMGGAKPAAIPCGRSSFTGSFKNVTSGGSGGNFFGSMRFGALSGVTGSGRTHLGSLGAGSYAAVLSLLYGSFKAGLKSSFSFYIGGSYKGSFLRGSFPFIIGGSINPALLYGSFKNAGDISVSDTDDSAALLSYFTSEPLNLYGYGINLI